MKNSRKVTPGHHYEKNNSTNGVERNECINSSSTICNILSQKEEFMIIGLTGRMGSGCSKVAEILSTPYEQLNFPHLVPAPGMNNLTNDDRAVRILAEYSERHWQKFDVIKASAILASFILDDDSAFINDMSKQTEKNSDVSKKKKKNLDKSKKNKKDSVSCLQSDEKTFDFKEYTTERFRKEVAENIQNHIGKLYSVSIKSQDNKKEPMEQLLIQAIVSLNKLKYCISDNASETDYTNYYEQIDNICEKINQAQSNENKWMVLMDSMDILYNDVLLNDRFIHRRKYLEVMDDILVLISLNCLINMRDETSNNDDLDANKVWKKLTEINTSITVDLKEGKENDIKQIEKYVFVKYIIGWFRESASKYMSEVLNADAYARLFQRYGQMIRYNGSLSYKNMKNATSRERHKDIFSIPRRINRYIKILRHPLCKSDQRPVHIVIDSIKNIFEAVYLRYRYSAFYLWAITTDSNIRERRLRDKHFTDIQVRMMDWNEYPKTGGDIIKKANEIRKRYKNYNKKELYQTIVKQLGEAEADFYMDILNNKDIEEDNKFKKIRDKIFLHDSYAFYTQDVDTCVCNSDVYLFNNWTEDDTNEIENYNDLLISIVRNVCLVMYPGIVKPTAIERCMQIAYSAKLNSGCLSRQVGAVVTDKEFNILSIGWNDVPCGEVPCAYKNICDIMKKADTEAYSDFELYDPEFRKQIQRYPENINLLGLPYSYCFKNAHKDVRDAMRSRAMHAEEKALGLCGKEAEGGYLFTTSSPCEMCSKKAKNKKISQIFYVEAYMGISKSQYINSGIKSNRAQLTLFSGAVGRAYTQMYTPVMPHKDILKYLGVHKS